MFESSLAAATTAMQKPHRSMSTYGFGLGRGLVARFFTTLTGQQTNAQLGPKPEIRKIDP